MSCLCYSQIQNKRGNVHFFMIIVDPPQFTLTPLFTNFSNFNGITRKFINISLTLDVSLL